MAKIGKSRRASSFRRMAGKKEPRSITLIVCEGETELAYFEVARSHYELTSAEVVVAENNVGPAPISVVTCAERRAKEPGSYDKIFCVFDRDGHGSFAEARQQIRHLANRNKKPLPIEEVVSIPCFEIWVLLHFERSDAPQPACADVIRRIHDRHMANYRKADVSVAGRLMARVDVAVNNAVWLSNRGADIDFNPFTQVHNVLQHFQTVAEEG